MPEAVAPAAAPAAPATQSTAPAPAEAVKPDANAWTQDDDKAFEALAKKRGFKVKANGEERSITRVDDLLKEFEFAAKGRGAAKLAEQTKAEREASKAETAKAREYAAIVERAAQGDYEARLKLGLVARDEQSQREQELASIPPEIRAVLEENAALQRKVQEAEAAREQYAKEQETARITAQREALRKQASGYLSKVFESSGLDLQADATEARPFLLATLQAMQEFDAAGLDLNADATADMVTRRAMELRSEASEKAYGKLRPERRLALTRPVLELLTDEVFGSKGDDGQLKAGSGDFKRVLEAVGPKAAAAIAKAYALSKKAAAAPAPTVATPPEPEKPKPAPPRPFWFGAGGR